MPFDTHPLFLLASNHTRRTNNTTEPIVQYIKSPPYSYRRTNTNRPKNKTPNTIKIYGFMPLPFLVSTIQSKVSRYQRCPE
jgi:hypothetical protein